MTADEPDLVELLIGHELALGRLCSRFVVAFPQRRGFWETLAREEQDHAVGLETLRHDRGASGWLLHKSDLKPLAIKSSIEYVDGPGRQGASGPAQRHRRWSSKP